jgi:hypothetical protein
MAKKRVDMRPTSFPKGIITYSATAATAFAQFPANTQSQTPLEDKSQRLSVAVALRPA